MDIVVVGGGAAGLMAAVTAAEHSKGKVTLLERNNFMGIKLNITGKGRCNVTNNCDLDTLLQNTVTNPRFLYSAYSAFSPQDVMDFFEQLNVPLKTERGQRVFPVSDRAKDITQALVDRLKALGVTIVQARAVEIMTKLGFITGVRTDVEIIVADSVILATGGLSYPKTGSSGDGIHMARTLGHTIVRTAPSLVALQARGELPSRLEGLSLKNVSFQLEQKGKTIYQEMGEMIFTADGISGPIVLSASAHFEPGEKAYGIIDLKPALDFETLDKRVLRDFDDNINRAFTNSLGGLLPAKLVPIIVELSGIDAYKKVNEVTKEERHRLVGLLKGLRLEIIGTKGYQEAVVTRGGVSVKEINPKTMESKKVQGLYFAGEIIDVDGYTGGFNLQIAWSTARAAGLAQE